MNLLRLHLLTLSLVLAWLPAEAFDPGNSPFYTRIEELVGAQQYREAIGVLEELHTRILSGPVRSYTREEALEALKRIYSLEQLYLQDRAAARKTALRILESLQGLPFDSEMARNAIFEFQDSWGDLFGITIDPWSGPADRFDTLAEKAIELHGPLIGGVVSRFALDRKCDEIRKLETLPSEARVPFLKSLGSFPGVLQSNDPLLFLETSMVFKDLVLDCSLLDVRMEANRDHSPAVSNWLRQRTLFRERFLALQGPGGGSIPESMVEELQTLVQDAPWHLRRGMRLSIPEIHTFLKNDTALIDYLAIPPDVRGTPATYAAILVSQGKAFGPVSIGSLAEVDREIASFRESIQHWLEDPASPEKEARVGTGAKALHTLLLDPLLSQIPGGIDRIILSPDGMLNLVPFPFLQNPEGRFLVETTVVSMIDSYRGLAVGASKGLNAESSVGDLLVGNPAFTAGGGAAATPPASPRFLPARSFGTTRNRDAAFFSDLPGAAEEVRVIAEGLSSSTPNPAILLVGEEATEDRVVTELARASRAHLATHGFTLITNPDAEMSASDTANPLDLSGLAFVGSDETMVKWQTAGISVDGNDGILLASEIATLDLSSLERVVLSACDTGLGQVVPNNGVVGLRRALSLAGVPEMIITLWPVLDNIPEEAMKEFYLRLQSGEAGPTAWTGAMRKMVGDFRNKGSSDSFIIGALGSFVFVSNRPEGSLLDDPARVVRVALQSTRGKPLGQILSDPSIAPYFTPSFRNRLLTTTGNHIGMVDRMLPDNLVFELAKIEGDEAYVAMRGDYATGKTFILVRGDNGWVIDDVL